MKYLLLLLPLLSLNFAGRVDELEKEAIDDFLKRSIPHGRNKRFVNAQEYLSAAETSPYLVRISRNNPVTNASRTICTGSIIREDLILTSGGCLFEDFAKFDKEKRLIPIWQLEVVAGDYDMNTTEATEQRRTPSQLFVHPDITMTDHRRMWKNDIAIIQVETEFVFDSSVNKIELWLSQFGVNGSAETVEFYTMVKASGYGNSGSENSIQYEDLFDTKYNYIQTVPQYQYYAYRPSEDGVCTNPLPAVSGIELGLVTYRPNANAPYSPTWMASAKRCFYTGTVKIAGYMPTQGDAGGPITWISPDNLQEYQLFLTPSQPAEKATFETDQNYQVWGELLSYYKDFIGNVFLQSAAASNSLTATDESQTHTVTSDISYFSTFHHYVHVEVQAGQSAQMNVTVTGSNALHTLRRAVLNIRQSDTKAILKNINDKANTKTSSLVITEESEGIQGSRWGCDLVTPVSIVTEPQESVPTSSPPIQSTSPDLSWLNGDMDWLNDFNGKRRKRDVAELTYNCANADLTGSESVPETTYTRVFNSYWPVVQYTASNGTNIDIEILIAKPKGSSDKGSVTLTIDYKLINGTESDDLHTCDEGYRICDDKLSCIAHENVCDGDRDCDDGHDETFWCLDTVCISSEYQCMTGECIKLRKLCDGTCDCLDTHICEDETVMCADNPFDKEKAKAVNIEVNGALSSSPVSVLYLMLSFLFLK